MQTVRTKAGERPVGSLKEAFCTDADTWLDSILAAALIANAETVRIETRDDGAIIATTKPASTGTICRLLAAQAEHALANELKERTNGRSPITLIGQQRINRGTFIFEYRKKEYPVDVSYGIYTEDECRLRNCEPFQGSLELRLQLSQANAA